MIIAVLIVTILLLVLIKHYTDNFSDYKKYKSDNIAAVMKSAQDNGRKTKPSFGTYKNIYPDLDATRYYKLLGINCDESCSEKVLVAIS